MKKLKLIQVLAVMLVSCLSLSMLTSCDDDEKNEAGGVDDLAYLQSRLAPAGEKVYGVQVGTDGEEILSRPVATALDALAEFYLLIPDGAKHEGLSTAADGTITCRLTDADGRPQGTLTYKPSTSLTIYYCAEVTLSAELFRATGVSQLRYITTDRWPESSSGFVKDILEQIKK